MFAGCFGDICVPLCPFQKQSWCGGSILFWLVLNRCFSLSVLTCKYTDSLAHREEVHMRPMELTGVLETNTPCWFDSTSPKLTTDIKMSEVTLDSSEKTDLPWAHRLLLILPIKKGQQHFFFFLFRILQRANLPDLLLSSVLGRSCNNWEGKQNKNKGKTKEHERKNKTRENLFRRKRSHNIPEYGFQPSGNKWRNDPSFIAAEWWVKTRSGACSWEKLAGTGKKSTGQHLTTTRPKKQKNEVTTVTHLQETW